MKYPDTDRAFIAFERSIMSKEIILIVTNIIIIKTAQQRFDKYFKTKYFNAYFSNILLSTFQREQFLVQILDLVCVLRMVLDTINSVQILELTSVLLLYFLFF